MNRHTILPRAPSAQRHRMIHPWLTAPAFVALEVEAKRRGTHLEKLAAQLIEVVSRDNLFAAVIDSD